VKEVAWNPANTGREQIVLRWLASRRKARQKAVPLRRRETHEHPCHILVFHQPRTSEAIISSLARELAWRLKVNVKQA